MTAPDWRAVADELPPLGTLVLGLYAGGRTARLRVVQARDADGQPVGTFWEGENAEAPIAEAPLYWMYPEGVE